MSVTMCFVIPQTITSNNDVIVRSVYYSDTLELIKYYLAIKASINAVRNIDKVRNLSIK